MADNSIIYSIRWDGLSMETFLYGTDVSYSDDGCVRFSNHLMPPGGVIKKWHSNVNYQAARREPSLPVLEEGAEYEIRSFLECTPKESVRIKLRFFDRQGEELSAPVLNSGIDTFTCPDGGFRYDLEIINAGMSDLIFHHIELQKKGEGDTNVRIIKKNGAINVIVLEPTGSSYKIPEPKLIRKFQNRVFVTSEEADAAILGIGDISRLPKDISPEKISVIGYGKKSNESAAALANYYGEGSRLYTFGHVKTEPEKGIKHIIYAEDGESEGEATEALSIMDPLLEKTERLSKFRFM